MPIFLEIFWLIEPVFIMSLLWLWDSMGLGTKNRKKQTADICKQHLREKHREKLGLLKEFILEIEGAPKNDVTRWGAFTDIKDIKEEMLKRVDIHFENWLGQWFFFPSNMLNTSKGGTVSAL